MEFFKPIYNPYFGTIGRLDYVARYLVVLFICIVAIAIHTPTSMVLGLVIFLLGFIGVKTNRLRGIGFSGVPLFIALVLSFLLPLIDIVIAFIPADTIKSKHSD